MLEEQLNQEVAIFRKKLDLLTVRLTNRFIEGRIKYSNPLDDIDYEKEIQQEIDDIIIYRLMQDMVSEL